MGERETSFFKWRVDLCEFLWVQKFLALRAISLRKLQILIEKTLDLGRNGRVKWAVEIKWIFLTSQNTQMVEFKWRVD